MEVVMASVIMLMLGLCGYMVGYCVRDDQTREKV